MEMLPFPDDNLIPEIEQLKEAITIIDGGTSYEFNNTQFRSIYTNLARNEHIRWVASLEMLGYTGPKETEQVDMVKCDEAAKIHPGMTAKNDANYQNNQQVYDHMLILSSFKLVSQELGDTKEEFNKARKEAIEKAIEKMLLNAIKKWKLEKKQELEKKRELEKMQKLERKRKLKKALEGILKVFTS